MANFAPTAMAAAIARDVLCFPVTHMSETLDFEEDPYRAHVGWMLQAGPAGVFAAGGTGEFFSLTPDEVEAVTRAAVATVRGRVPVIVGAGYGTAIATDLAKRAERAGADAILLLPPYLLNASQAGLMAHVEAVCRATGIGVIVYNRNVCKLTPNSLAILAERCPNLIGFKDGIGDIELMMSIFLKMGDRFAYLDGLPTAEVYAAAYKALGTPVYSSAVFNFIPRTAMQFYEAVARDDQATQHRLLKDFFMPYLDIRNQGAGYAVSIVKAGAQIVGHGAGPVRPPLTDLKPAEFEQLASLIQALGPQ